MTIDEIAENPDLPPYLYWMAQSVIYQEAQEPEKVLGAISTPHDRADDDIAHDRLRGDATRRSARSEPGSRPVETRPATGDCGVHDTLSASRGRIARSPRGPFHRGG